MLRTESIQFSYNEASEFLFPDVRLEQGDKCLLLGGSGSGKTTLLHIIGGLLKCQRGTVTINGTKLSTLTESELDRFRGRHIGFVFQKHHLIPALTVRENLLMPDYLNRNWSEAGKIAETLELLDLARYAEVNVRKLSHGQMQRVAIARAVMNRPIVLLADEPTSALDDENCEKVIGLLQQVVTMCHAILLIATHDQRLKAVIDKQVAIRG